MENEKVYILTSGEYSDYHIVGVFKTHYDAWEYVNKQKLELDDDYDIEEYEYGESGVLANKNFYNIKMDSKGNLISIDLYKGKMDNTNPIRIKYDRWSQDEEGRYKWYIEGQVYASDEKHAVKIANEKRLQFIASNK